MSTVPEPVQAAALVAAVCREAYRIWENCQSLARGGDEHLVILKTHHHILEQLDAVGVLIRAGAVEPSKLQLRAAFESLLTLEYVMEADTKRRAYAWLVVVDVLERIKTWERFDPGTQSGRKFAELCREEGHILPAVSSAEGSAAALKRMLESDPRWTEAYAEYKQVKAALKRQPEWYELFGGPGGPGVRSLALHLRWGAYYEVLYRLWSRRIHGADVVQRVKRAPGGGLLVQPLRYAADVGMVLNFAVTFGLQSTRLLIRYYCPDEEAAFRTWYLEVIGPALADCPGRAPGG